MQYGSEVLGSDIRNGFKDTTDTDFWQTIMVGWGESSIVGF